MSLVTNDSAGKCPVIYTHGGRESERKLEHCRLSGNKAASRSRLLYSSDIYIYHVPMGTSCCPSHWLPYSPARVNFSGSFSMIDRSGFFFHPSPRQPRRRSRVPKFIERLQIISAARTKPTGVMRATCSLNTFQRRGEFLESWFSIE